MITNGSLCGKIIENYMGQKSLNMSLIGFSTSSFDFLLTVELGPLFN